MSCHQLCTTAGSGLVAADPARPGIVPGKTKHWARFMSLLRSVSVSSLSADRGKMHGGCNNRQVPDLQKQFPPSALSGSLKVEARVRNPLGLLGVSRLTPSGVRNTCAKDSGARIRSA